MTLQKIDQVLYTPSLVDVHLNLKMHRKHDFKKTIINKIIATVACDMIVICLIWIKKEKTN